MKYLKYYDTTAEYTADAPNRTNPTISYDKGGKKIHVDEVIYTSDTKRETWNIYFVDVDGTVLSHQYVEEGGDIEYPADPTHEGYTFVGWNQTATTANSTDFYNDGVYKMIVIGPMYELTDAPENTTFNCIINTNVTGKTYGVKMACSVATGVTINWGDGSTSTSTATAATNYTHTYTTSGKYNVTIQANSGTYSFSGSSSTPFMFDFKRTCTEITIGTKCTAISGYTFVNCNNIQTIKMHKDLVLQSSAGIFQNCFNLKELILPTCLTEVTTNVFYSCCNLSAIIFPSNFKKLSGYIGINLYNNRYISIPSGLTYVAATFPFSENSYLTAFSSVIFKPASGRIIYNKTPIETVYSYIKTDTLSGKTDSNITEVTIPSTATSIAHAGFNRCYNLEKVNFNEKITTINSYAFEDCHSLKKFDCPDTISTFGTNIFNNCYSLEEFSSSQITAITNCMFQYCYSLREVNVPNLKVINSSYAFYFCYSLREIELPEGMTAINGSAFYWCTSLSGITIPSTVTALGTNLCLNCYSLSHATVKSDCAYIPLNGFNSATSLITLEYTDNIEKVPRFGSSSASTTIGTTGYICTTNLTFIVVPDGKYEEWYASPYWVNYKQYIIKRSDYEAIIGTT